MRLRVPIVVLYVLFPGINSLARAAEWPQISKEELAMTDDAKNPGASAILLYREVNSDDLKSLHSEYLRIKILNDEGKKYADIEIPYLEKEVQIENIRARTVRPDGTPVEFNGQIFDRTVLRGRRIKVQVKTLTLPEVQNGSIIEYSYVAHSSRKVPDVLKKPADYTFARPVAFPSAKWILLEELSTRRARFTFRPVNTALLHWIYYGPVEVKPQSRPDGTIVLDLENLPRFRSEEYATPEEDLKGWIGFYYLVGARSLPLGYWSDVGAEMAPDLARFVGDAKKFKQTVAAIISASDPPEAQLRKLYARVQQLRYVSDEPAKTDQQIKRENLKENKSVADVLKNGYATTGQANLAMVALARAAGFDSAPLWIKSRDRSLFYPSYPPISQLDAEVVWVRAGGKDYFLDPGTRYCPFGLLPWQETATAGVVISEQATPIETNGSNGFSGLVPIPASPAAQAVVKRDAFLQLDSEGSVDGTIHVEFVGQEALERRLAALNQDETTRKKELVDEVKEWIAAPATVELQGAVNWEETEQPLRANFQVRVSEYASPTGRRLLFRSGFVDGAKKPFQSDQRINDIYLPHPYEETDDVTWKLPSGFRLASLPQKMDMPTQFGNYAIGSENVEGGVRLRRHMSLNIVYTPVGQYFALRAYMNSVRQGDEGQIVLEKSDGNASN